VNMRNDMERQRLWQMTTSDSAPLSIIVLRHVCFLRTWTRRLPMLFEAIVRKRFLPGRMDGDWTVAPADFLIGPGLKGRRARSGVSRHMHQHCLPPQAIISYCRVALSAPGRRSRRIAPNQASPLRYSSDALRAS
jgi:hypothetical protein